MENQQLSNAEKSSKEFESHSNTIQKITELINSDQYNQKMCEENNPQNEADGTSKTETYEKNEGSESEAEISVDDDDDMAQDLDPSQRNTCDKDTSKNTNTVQPAHSEDEYFKPLKKLGMVQLNKEKSVLSSTNSISEPSCVNSDKICQSNSITHNNNGQSSFSIYSSPKCEKGVSVSPSIAPATQPNGVRSFSISDILNYKKTVSSSLQSIPSSSSHLERRGN